MPILFQKGILCTSNYNDMEHKPEIDGVELNENTTKEDLDIDKVFQYRGQVASYNKLPTSGLHIGDTYNVQDTGENYAWNGSSWDCLTGAEAIYYKDGTLKSQDQAIGIDADKNTISNLVLEDITDITATATEVNVLDGITASTAELNYVDGVTSSIQTQLNGKEPTITGAATTITSSNLTKNRAVIANNSGKIAISDTTSTELGYVHGVTSAIQTQLNSKVDENAAITGATHTKITYDSKGLVTAGADLAASDIPSLTLSKISDVSATSTEVNYLSGTTSNVQTQLDSKASKLTVVQLEATASITVADSTIYNGGTQTSLTIALPAVDIFGFLCEIDFSSGATATDWDDDGNLTWFGDNVINNTFTPVANKRYTIIISFNGIQYMAVVKGV